MPALTGKPGSCWVATAEATDYPPLEGSIHAETVVVGAGIVGLTVALRLAEAGRSVIVLEGLRVGQQVTGRSSAKITTQHRLIYRRLIDTLGTEQARAYADANKAGVDRIGSWIREYDIACDLERKPAYTYTQDPGLKSAIEAEAEAARTLGLSAEVVDRAPLPFDNAGALVFPDQAQFNPAMYLTALARAVADRGGRIFEESRARFIGEASRWRVVTDGGTVHAENVVVATNMTVKSPVGMANRTQPRSHTVMAFRIDDSAPIDGMFITVEEEQSRSLRTGRDAEGPLLLALGPRFNTGQEGDVASRFAELEDWARGNLPVGETVWRWCNEDYDTADRVPYAGEPDPEKAPGFHIATGFNAWGISNGAAVGMMIADAIMERPTPWKALYDPTRPYPEDFHKSGESQSVVESVDDIAPGHGGVLVKDKKHIAAWRDEAGKLHTMSAHCTHKGCPLTWNNADRTWDCPCHGSIFAADGTVLHGPARVPLPPERL
ncbi:FAD-dependent oxidoreductase [Nitratireductor thuwali]|uniref:Gamma-glutamylputrescine oxidoreductase n=1 Tax=Nitratireductor thuwali TaxID=2267699 RepID=A0ABY5MCZ5_9HYPH|nr:Gamma-glutamylputrescine oxidoreductase [Nitratireductor thuwali]